MINKGSKIMQLNSIKSGTKNECKKLQNQELLVDTDKT